MFTNLNDALETMYKRSREREFKLVHFKRCLEDLGNPQYQLKAIHVGGTNGKGSTTNFINSILSEGGYKVGMFTSPHLVVHNDRFRIGQTFISDDDLLALINRSVPLWETYGLSFFELDVLIAIWYFLDQEVDYAIFEVGLGGRLDATNVLHPIATVITNISMDHTNVLGNSLREIATEKAGIINEHGFIFTGEKKDDLQTIFKEKSKRQIYPVKAIENLEYTNQHIEFTYRDYPVVLSSPALYQAANAALAFEVLYQLYHKDVINLNVETILSGLKKAQWAGRFEVVQNEPLVLLDGAHNLAGMQNLVTSLEVFEQPKVVVFTALKDKDYSGMLEILEAHVDEIYITTFEHMNRNASLEQLTYEHPHKVFDHFPQAILAAIDWAKAQKGMVVVCGSLYFISEARAFILENKQ